MNIEAATDSKKFKCTFESCNWSFSTCYKLERHIKTHTKEKGFVCNKCSKAFANSYNLIAHIKTHTKAPVICHHQGCNKVFDSQKDLYIHFDNHHGPLKCPKKRCLKLFSSQIELQEHITNHDFQYKCKHNGCTKRFRKPSALKIHEFSHTNEKPFKCTVKNCIKSFSTKNKLQRHALIHENNKSFICAINECGKGFNCKEYLIAHERTHQETKPIECPEENCFKHFSCSSTLKVHLKKHADDRPHQCSFKDCSKAYLTASNLRAHEKSHNRQKILSSSSPSIDIMDDGKSNVEEYIDINELMNMPALDISIMSKEELVAAAFGEFACNQYMNCDTITAKNSSSKHSHKHDVNVLNDLDKEKLKDLQEEFVRNIYASSVNTDHSFFPTYLVPPGNNAKYSTSPPLFMDSSENVDNVGVSASETVTLEPSMELSTGHMEIDAACFEASSCMPDHIYSNKMYENSSTVNLQDIH
jgi:Zinc finger, C2H2 type.